MLQQYGQNPEQNWKAKDCAIYLVMALTVRGKTAAQGATTTNQLVNVMDFFNQHVLPELQSQQLDQRPVLKADSLKYLTTFRSQVPKDTCVQVSLDIPMLLHLAGLSCIMMTQAYSCCRSSGSLWCSLDLTLM